MGNSVGPTILILKRFQNEWPESMFIIQTRGSKWKSQVKLESVRCILNSWIFKNTSREQQSWKDYREFIGYIFMFQGHPSLKVMEKAIYWWKIFLFLGEFASSRLKENRICDSCIFLVSVNGFLFLLQQNLESRVLSKLLEIPIAASLKFLYKN